MKLQTALLALLVATGAAACSDESTTEPQSAAVTAAPQAARAPTTMIEDVTGVITGGTFVGTVQVTEFAFENGQLVTSGVVNGVATIGGIGTQITNQEFTAPATLVSPNQVCDVLFLDLGPLFLDVLGLTVDLSQIVLDINAVPGAGNLLGNLLCAVVNLLNNPLGNIQGLLNLLDLINNILG